MKINVIQYSTYYNVEVEVEHSCDEFEPLEKCPECYDNWLDGYKQFKEDQYREQDNDW